MASLFGHGLVGYVTGTCTSSKKKQLIYLCVLSAIIPDIDVLGFYLGIPYDAPLGHRGFSHSIVFAVLWTLLLLLFFKKQRSILNGFLLCLATLSHSVLDALTNGGRGVGFFIPFDTTRYFFPYRPIVVSPIGVKRFFSQWGLEVLISEFLIIGLPCLLLLLFKKYFK